MRDFLIRKDKIILNAIDIINELGMQGLSIKEIAFREGITESAIYRHFKSKDEILIGILEYYSQFDQSIYNSVIKQNIDCYSKIMHCVKAYIEYYGNYPAITAILNSYEILSHEASTKEKVREIFSSRLKCLTELIQDGQNKEEISSSYTAEEISHIIIGLCRSMILEWRMADCSYPLKEKVLAAISKFCTTLKIVNN
jgi:Transcriptional regulator